MLSLDNFVAAKPHRKLSIVNCPFSIVTFLSRAKKPADGNDLQEAQLIKDNIMHRIATGIFISFAHHIRGHSGPCISLHGHTWKFEVALCASELDAEGFVVDFGLLRKKVLTPCHTLLDHSLAMGEDTWSKNKGFLTPIGADLLGSRAIATDGTDDTRNAIQGELNGARNEFPGGIKVAVFPFNPTSERLAEWLYGIASANVEEGRVTVAATRVFESLHPVESVAEFVRGW